MSNKEYQPSSDAIPTSYVLAKLFSGEAYKKPIPDPSCPTCASTLIQERIKQRSKKLPANWLACPKCKYNVAISNAPSFIQLTEATNDESSD